jgi:hypothetical protein
MLKHRFCLRLTEQANVAKTLQTCTREVFHSNTGQDTGYPE